MMEVACQLTTPELREREAWLARSMRDVVVAIDKESDGFSLAFTYSDEALMRIAEWMTLERLFCPFLSFQLDLESEGDLRLKLTGPAGTVAFLEGTLIAALRGERT